MPKWSHISLFVYFCFCSSRLRFFWPFVFIDCFCNTDNTTFFLNDKKSAKGVINVFGTFSLYSGLKPNKIKCEISRIWDRKGVSMELCKMKCIDLKRNSVKIMAIYFSYNKKFENKGNFVKFIKKIENVLKI